MTACGTRCRFAPFATLDNNAIDALFSDADALFPISETELVAAQHLGLDARARDADTDYVYATARLSQLQGRAVRRKPQPSRSIRTR